MGLKSTTGIVTWNTSNRQIYEELGYTFTRYKDKFEVPIEQLTNGSTAIVDVECDYCHNLLPLPYKRYIALKGDTYCCPNCIAHMKKIRNENGNLIFIEVKHRNRDWLYEQYITKGRLAEDIAKECCVNVRTLREWISKFELFRESKTEYITKEILEELYSNKHMTTLEIGDKFGVSDGTILSLLKKFEIPVPTRSELLNTYYNEKGGREKAREIASLMENRIKSSCRQRGIPIEEFDGFVKSENDLARTSWEYDEWRKKVLERDDYTCQCCGNRGGNLHVHHKYNFSKYINLRYDIDNGMTLCERCHSVSYPNSFHSIYGERNNTPEQLEEYILARRQV